MDEHFTHKQLQHSSLVAHWFLFRGEHGSNPGGQIIFPRSFLSCDLMIAAYLRILVDMGDVI